jgi:hypothetical protein
LGSLDGNHLKCLTKSTTKLMGCVLSYAATQLSCLLWYSLARTIYGELNMQMCQKIVQGQ